MAVQNLLRTHRFLNENTILVGIIPGPKEPHFTINTFLEPLVEELLQLWEGVFMKSVHVKHAVKTFPTAQFGEKPDYSGFDRQGWTARSNETHRHHDAFQQKICQTHSDQVDIERQHGCRYSVLLRLPYFDAIRMCVIDPMHNLFTWNYSSYDDYLERIQYRKSSKHESNSRASR